jgi:hypothetical protein
MRSSRLSPVPAASKASMVTGSPNTTRIGCRRGHRPPRGVARKCR